MQINIRIAGWKLTGFRCPDHEVDFSNTKNGYFGISLIQMPNGTGKTTTLEILRMTLSGSATEKSPDELRRFQKKDASQGLCEIKIDLNKKFITFQLIVDFSTGKAHYRTTQGAGQLNGFSPPPEVRKFFNSEFIDYFILDGELAKKLFSPQQSAAQRVIDALFQVDTLKRISQRVLAYWSDQTSNSTATTQQGFTRRKNAVEELEGRLKLRASELAGFEKELKTARASLKSKVEVFQTAINENTTRGDALGQAHDDLNRVKLDLYNKTMEVLDSSSRPQCLSVDFAQAIKSFKLGLDRVKLPEAAAREFFEELCDEIECICGRPIDQGISKIIKTRANQYLGSNDVSLLNTIKTSIDEEIPDNGIAQPNADYSALLKELANLRVKEAELQTKVSNLEIEAGAEDPTVADAQKQIIQLELSINDLTKKIDRYTDLDSDDDEYCPAVIKKKLDKAKNDLAEISNTLVLKNKTDRLSEILNRSYDIASGKITGELVSETNSNLDNWLPNNDVRVEKIQGHLVLRNGQAQGSEGENLSIAYAFLSTLFNRSSHSLPFIVDSPAGALGLKIRREIGQTIPTMTEQFVSFVTTSERQGFLEGGLDTSGKSIQFITIFRSRITDYAVKASTIHSSHRTSDGIVVEDEEFFKNFELESEA
jgi:DNA sulfur modification protein DndD